MRCNWIDQALWLLQQLIVGDQGSIDFRSGDRTAALRSGDCSDIAACSGATNGKYVALLDQKCTPAFGEPIEQVGTAGLGLLPPFGILTRPKPGRPVLCAMQGSGTLCGSCGRQDPSRAVWRGEFSTSRRVRPWIMFVNQDTAWALHLRLDPLWPSFTGKPSRCPGRQGHGRTLSVLG